MSEPAYPTSDGHHPQNHPVAFKHSALARIPAADTWQNIDVRSSHSGNQLPTALPALPVATSGCGHRQTDDAMQQLPCLCLFQ